MKAIKIESAKRQYSYLKATEEHEFAYQEGIENQLINIYPQRTYQTISGFGGAFTESAAVTLQEMSPDNYQKVMDAYFGPDGIGYSFCRTHIHSCDFSLGNYAYAEKPDLSDFSIERDKQSLIPMIQAAQKAAGQPIRLLASPWSPPAFMKTTGEMNHGGKLKPEYRELWSRYIARYIEEYRKESIDIYCISVQNEPNAKQIWDSCLYTAEDERDLVRDYLGPEMEKLGVKILVWDHNKERVYERACVTLGDPLAAKYIHGIGFHWYSGDHFESLSLTKELFPDKELIFTEGCMEQFIHADEQNSAEHYAHDMIGNLNNGCSAFMDWNMTLNECGGPNHVSNFCAAPILCDTRNDVVHKLMPYYYIGQISKYVVPGSKRIAFSKYSDRLDVSAFLRPDGKRVVLVLNRSDSELPFVVREGDWVCRMEAKPHSMNTIIYA